MSSSLELILYTTLIMLIFVVIALAIVFFVIKKKEDERNNQDIEKMEETLPRAKNTSTTKIAKEYEKRSVFDFMEFEDVKDNMIIQKNGRKFLMVIECKGINYDLMSELEKASTEQGFSSFLNTLREPIQIYIQTRTINLEKNILEYQERVEKLRDDINLKEYKLKEYAERPNVNEKVLKNKQFEILRQKNLYSYGADIVANTKKMSLNKNVLKKKYYVIIKYYYEATDENDTSLLSEDEIRETAFSNLYTKALSLISVLSGIGIEGRALNSFELVELLYNAYNRDDSEVFGIEKALEAGYDEVYIDSENIIDKKLIALNKEIQVRAEEAAKDAIEKILDEKSEDLKYIEDNIDGIVAELAKQMIEDEKNNISEDIKEQAIEEIKNGKGGKKKVNGKQNTKEPNGKRKAS